MTDDWVRAFRHPRFNLGTCRDLAGADAQELAHKLREHQASQQKKPTLPGAALPTEDELQSWISACQSDEMDVIMMDIVDQDEDVLECLELCQVATPKDVSLWSSLPASLISTLSREVDAEKYARIEGKLTADAIKGWGRKAKEYLEALPWVELWSSD